MYKRIPVFGIITDRNKFFRNLEVGDIFVYSWEFTSKTIKKISEKHGLITKYCEPRSPEYTRYGSFTMKVMEIKDNIPKYIKKEDVEQKVYFDLKYLNI